MFAYIVQKALQGFSEHTSLFINNTVSD